MSDLQVFAKYFKFINKIAQERCNCENSACNHKPARCENSAKGKRIMYLGDVCDSCYDNMPVEYRLPEKLDPDMDFSSIPDPPIKPGVNRKHPENPHHMKHRVDIDPDSLSEFDLHPDAPQSPFGDEDWDGGGLEGEILLDPKSRARRLKYRRQPFGGRFSYEDED